MGALIFFTLWLGLGWGLIAHSAYLLSQGPRGD